MVEPDLQAPTQRRRKHLRVPDEGCCAFHPCDDCERCKTGDCCGSDVGEAGLPLEGSWPYEHHGKVGILDVRADSSLRCACCGEWFANLGRHVGSHNLTADAYRAMWGLNCTQALMSAELVAFRSQLGRVYGHRIQPDEALMPTREQRSKWARNREARAQRRIALGQQSRDTAGRWVEPTPGRILARLTPSENNGTTDA